LTAQHVLSDIISHHQELLKCNYSFWFYSRLSLPVAVMAEWELAEASSHSAMTAAGNDKHE
jgi:hypothetical protein